MNPTSKRLANLAIGIILAPFVLLALAILMLAETIFNRPFK